MQVLDINVSSVVTPAVVGFLLPRMTSAATETSAVILGFSLYVEGKLIGRRKSPGPETFGTWLGIPNAPKPDLIDGVFQTRN